MAIRFFRAFKRQQRTLQIASGAPCSDSDDLLAACRPLLLWAMSHAQVAEADLLTPADELQKAQALLQEKESKVELLEESLKDVKGKVNTALGT